MSARQKPSSHQNRSSRPQASQARATQEGYAQVNPLGTSLRAAKPPKKKHRMRGFVIVVVILAVLGAGAFLFKDNIMRLYYNLEYTDYIQQAGEKYEVNPYWIAAMIKCESDFDPNAVSKAGAVGLMQMMPDTAADIAQRGLVDTELYDPQNLTDPETNINYGTAYLRYLVERYHEMNPAIAAYNAGMANVDKWLSEDDDVRASVDFSETEEYIHRVNRAKEKYEQLYPGVFEG